jgi:hypothetical protein
VTTTPVSGCDPEAEFCDLLARVHLQTDLTKHLILDIDDDHIDPNACNVLLRRTFDPGCREVQTSVRWNRIPTCDLGVVPRTDEH